MAEYFAMGGYAGFVWTAYGASFVALVGLGLLSWRAHARAKERLEKVNGE